MPDINNHEGLPARQWEDGFSESPPDFVEAEGFEEAVSPFIEPPETFDSLFTWKAHEGGGISWRLHGWWQEERPAPGSYYFDTIAGYAGFKRCRIFVEVTMEHHGHQIVYHTADEAPALAEEEDDSGDQ